MYETAKERREGIHPHTAEIRTLHWAHYHAQVFAHARRALALQTRCEAGFSSVAIPQSNIRFNSSSSNRQHLSCDWTSNLCEKARTRYTTTNATSPGSLREPQKTSKVQCSRGQPRWHSWLDTSSLHKISTKYLSISVLIWRCSTSCNLLASREDRKAIQKRPTWAKV